MRVDLFYCGKTINLMRAKHGEMIANVDMYVCSRNGSDDFVVWLIDRPACSAGRAVAHHCFWRVKKATLKLLNFYSMPKLAPTW